MQQVLRQYGNFLIAAVTVSAILSALLVHFWGADGGILGFIGSDFEVVSKENSTDYNPQSLASNEEVIKAVESKQPEVKDVGGLKTGITYSGEDLVVIDGAYESVRIIEVYDWYRNNMTGAKDELTWDPTQNTITFVQSGVYIIRIKINTEKQSYTRELVVGISG
ncbi:hypothetical protein SAMN02910453_2119 [Lachnospiraceae bacterium A10]|nr:hypothetical protein SAMN02910453_2119 [Lachnospiraceae bacterium A10]